MTLSITDRRRKKRARASAGLFDEMIIDNFAGGGGASIGIERAIGRAVDVAINHDRAAVEMHAANHPHTAHLCEDVWNVDPMTATGGRPVGLAWFSPDCFPAGTMVLTKSGYRPIEEIEIGEQVLTHKGRWRNVVELHRSRKPLRIIRGHGHPGILCSDEHPFFTRHRTNHYDSGERRGYWSLGLPEWTNAEFVVKGNYWASPISFPLGSIPDVKGRGLTGDSRLMWLAGRYVGDGWTRLTDTRAELVIICGKHEAVALGEKLKGMWPRIGERSTTDELAWHDRELRTACQFSTNHRGLIEWLRHEFGHGAQSKTLPGWVLGLSADLRSAFLDGYMSADGWKSATFAECNTVSKSLAFGIKALVGSLGKTACVYLNNSNTTEIEDRIVNARPMWRVRWREEIQADHSQTRRDDLHEWCPVRENTSTSDVEPVFNIAVEEDESYVVEGIVVHNCKHFSRAKGGKPVEKKIRGLAWIVVKWAKAVRPRIIMLENVREFEEWGPLIHAKDTHGKPMHTSAGEPIMLPDKSRKGETFRRWVSSIRKLGYQVEWRSLNAADYGAPTHRRRLFLIARRDGKPIVWPAPTHGPKSKGKKKYRTAAECIDWSLPCPSIFLTKEEAKAFGVKRPLAEKTMRRIAMGLKRFVIDNPKPFIVNVQHGGDEFRGQSMDEPLSTVTGKHGYGVVTPFVAGVGGRAGQSPATGGDAPIGTITAKNDRALITPILISSYGEAPHQQTRGQAVDAPLNTVTPANNTGVLIAPTLVQFNGEKSENEGRGQSLTEPINTIPTENRFAVAAPYLAKFRGDSSGSAIDEPCPTITSGAGSKRPAGAAHAMGVVAPILVGAGGPDYSAKPAPVDAPIGTVMAENHRATCAAFLAKHYGGVVGHGVEQPIGTVTAVDHHSLVAANMVHFNHGAKQASSCNEPMRTVMAGTNHAALVYSFLVKYFGCGIGQEADGPLHTITGKDRFGLVTVQVNGEPYVIVDIGLRMLTPRELARAQGFPENYKLTGTKSNQVARIGNSVSPVMSEALVRANLWN